MREGAFFSSLLDAPPEAVDASAVVACGLLARGRARRAGKCRHAGGLCLDLARPGL
jgi:hypothetical protein